MTSLLNPKPGDVWKQWTWDAEIKQWICTGTGADAPIHQGGGVWIGPVAPSHPAQGNLWFDGSRMRIWDHGQWVDVVSQGGQGPQGPQGNPGPPGQSIQGQQGPAGPQGQRGPQGIPGQGIAVKGTVPTAGDLPSGAAVGDLYVDEATTHGWVWNGTTWIDIGQLSSDVPGPQGPEGPQGAQGPAGAASTVPGPQGPPGAAGSQGPAGAQGPPGPTGSPGAPGVWDNSSIAAAGGPWIPTALGIGSYVIATTSSPFFVSTAGAVYNLAAIWCPAGDWDVWCDFQISTSGWASYGVVFARFGIEATPTTQGQVYPQAMTQGIYVVSDGYSQVIHQAPLRFAGGRYFYLNCSMQVPPGAQAPLGGAWISGRIQARKWG